MLESLVGLDAGTTARLLGLLVPLLVAFITKKYASAGLKGFLNLVASAIVGSVVYLVAEDGGYDWTGFVNGTLDTFIVSIMAYYGVLKPTGIAGSITNATAGFGLGPKPTLQTESVGAEEAGEHVHRNDTGAISLIEGLVIFLVIVVVLALIGVVSL